MILLLEEAPAYYLVALVVVHLETWIEMCRSVACRLSLVVGS